MKLYELISGSGKKIILSALLLLFFESNAQENCGFNSHQKFLGTKGIIQKNEILEGSKLLNDFNQKLGNGVQQTSEKSNQVYTVSVVVHVLHNGEAVGVGTNISDAQIQAAITNLSANFRGVNGIGTDTEIEFCLASRDPNGCPSNGIVRVNASGVPNYALKGISQNNSCGAADEYVVKNLSSWSTYYYYNIWIVNLIECSSTLTQAYATPPTGDPYDGCVILASAMNGTSTTLTHEVGHGFNLLHTYEGDFGGVVCPADVSCSVDGDKICDTPPHKQTDCGTINTCTTNGIWDNSRFNFMSSCGQRDRFTPDQKTAMRTTFLSFPRQLLLFSNGCSPSIFGSVINQSNVSCYGSCDGAISVTPGCNSTYTYSWSNGSTGNSINNVCAGNYSVTITDASNYSATLPFSITEPTQITVVPATTGTSCNGASDGSISLNVGGGVPFTCGANYSITIGNGTVVPASTQFPAPFGNSKKSAKHQVFFHQSEMQALGFNSGKISSVALNVASINGTSIYRNFQVQIKAIPNVGSLTVLQSGLQTVFGPQDISISPGWNTFYFTSPFQWNGTTSLIVQFCFADTVSTFNSPVYCSTMPFKSTVYLAKDSSGICSWVPGPSVSTSTFTRPNIRFGVCNDSLNYAYTWSTGSHANSINGLSSGNYSVTVYDANGCIGTAFDSVGQANPFIDAGADVLIVLGDSTVIGGSPTASGFPPFTYSWFPATGLNSTTISNPTAQPISNTTYVVTVTDVNGCYKSDSVVVSVNTSIGIQYKDLSADLSMKIDAVNEQLLFQSSDIPSGTYQLQLSNSIGKVLKEQSILVKDRQLNYLMDTQQLSNGYYLIKLFGINGATIFRYIKS